MQVAGLLPYLFPYLKAIKAQDKPRPPMLASGNKQVSENMELPDQQELDGKDQLASDFEKIVQPLSMNNLDRHSSPLQLTRSRFDITENAAADSNKNAESPSMVHPSSHELLENDILSISRSPEYSKERRTQRSDSGFPRPIYRATRLC